MYDMNKNVMLLIELVRLAVSVEDFKISTVMAIYNHIKHNITTTMILDIMTPH